MRFIGMFFGTPYDMEFDTDEEMIDWMIEVLQNQSPLTIKILKKLMEQE